MTVHALEPQPLAFRVRPQADECFDSWIDRVAAAGLFSTGKLVHASRTLAWPLRKSPPEILVRSGLRSPSANAETLLTCTHTTHP